jgi:hypothetical protein
MYRLHHQGHKLRSVILLPVTANIVPNSQILIALMMVAIRSSETSVSQDPHGVTSQGEGILHSHRRENLKSYMTLTGWAL